MPLLIGRKDRRLLHSGRLIVDWLKSSRCPNVLERQSIINYFYFSNMTCHHFYSFNIKSLLQQVNRNIGVIIISNISCLGPSQTYISEGAKLTYWHAKSVKSTLCHWRTYQSFYFFLVLEIESNSGTNHHTCDNCDKKSSTCHRHFIVWRQFSTSLSEKLHTCAL